MALAMDKPFLHTVGEVAYLLIFSPLQAYQPQDLRRTVLKLLYTEHPAVKSAGFRGRSYLHIETRDVPPPLSSALSRPG